jgi:hypothetical protein
MRYLGLVASNFDSTRGRRGSSTGFKSASLGFQLASKLTIGRPGLSLTAVGVGSLGLRSFNFMLVARRMSSPRISSPSLVGTSGAFSVMGTGGFAVYAGFRDCEGGFLWISVRERELVDLRGMLFEVAGRSCSN